MDVVLDSVAVNHLLRRPKKERKGGRVRFETGIDEYLRSARLRIRIDPPRGLVHEWERTCGLENIKNLVTHWEQWGTPTPVDALGRIPNQVSNRLRALGFEDTIDKLVLKIAMVTNDHT